ncbi:hypothetical protein ABEB36_007155 [Hypothenemus hampei]|uniref:ATP synthase F0 subunit 8 n=1 Tax=Hypothenemus hampei TaxID=57062 RepID=A0ABD1ET41_HYPHA
MQFCSLRICVMTWKMIFEKLIFITTLQFYNKIDFVVVFLVLIAAVFFLSGKFIYWKTVALSLKRMIFSKIFVGDEESGSITEGLRSALARLRQRSTPGNQTSPLHRPQSNGIKSFINSYIMKNFLKTRKITFSKFIDRITNLLKPKELITQRVFNKLLFVNIRKNVGKFEIAKLSTKGSSLVIVKNTLHQSRKIQNFSKIIIVPEMQFDYSINRSGKVSPKNGVTSSA